MKPGQKGREAGPREHHISLPPSGSGRGVLVLHSWWGLTSFFTGLCDQLAGNGFLALAPDLYGGDVARTIPAAKALRAAATARRREPVYRLLERKIEHLVQHRAHIGPRIGVIGFSMGGHWAYWLAQRPEYPIAATVTFYAARGGDFSNTGSAFLCHFAEHDEWVSPAALTRLRRRLSDDGARFAFHVYPNTGHWFAESDREDAFDPAAAELAWSRTLEFLDATL